MTKMCANYFICVTVLLFQNAFGQIAVYQLELKDLYKMQTGIGWPHSLHVVEGNEALLRLAAVIENQESCEITTPAGRTFDVERPPNDRYERWTDDGCGLRVKSVTHSDQGRWRLTARRGDVTITGWTELYVQDNVDEYEGPPITLHDGEVHTNVNLTSLANSYCLVAQPFSDRTLVAGHCNVTLDRTTRAVQGNWHVLLGLPGRVSELPIDRSVFVESERLNTGFIHRGNKLHLYCNLLHSEKNITFCRFQRTSAQAGFNVMDGLSDGSNSYYGRGFAQRQCGMTIEKPEAADFGSWRCTVGVQERVGNVIWQRTPLQALIRVTGEQSRRHKRSLNESTAVRTVFVQKDMTVTITCEAEESLSYCWFQHPNGTQFTPVPLVNDDQYFWYSGQSLSVGDCGITFTHVAEEDGGVWTCHMGPKGEMGVEITDRVNVRVTGPLAAREKEVVAPLGGNATLFCHSSNGNRPLDYCRFLSPTSLGISIDETVTRETPILERFYFTPGRELNYGDCSLIISPVLEEDVGVWTCAALVDDEVIESRDTILLKVEVTRQRSVASIVGMSVGLSALFLIFGGVMLYKYGNLSTIMSWRRTNNTDRTDTVSIARPEDTESTRTEDRNSVVSWRRDNDDAITFVARSGDTENTRTFKTRGENSEFEDDSRDSQPSPIIEILK